MRSRTATCNARYHVLVIFVFYFFSGVDLGQGHRPCFWELMWRRLSRAREVNSEMGGISALHFQRIEGEDHVYYNACGLSFIILLFLGVWSGWSSPALLIF